MSDEKLRELERAFRETGSEEAELAWLRERARAGEKLDWESYSRLHELDVEAAAAYLRWRVEVGDLTQERLELAAHCGHFRPQGVPSSEAAWASSIEEGWPKAGPSLAVAVAREFALPLLESEATASELEEFQIIRRALENAMPSSIPRLSGLTVLANGPPQDHPARNWAREVLSRIENVSTTPRPLADVLTLPGSVRMLWNHVNKVLSEAAILWSLS